MAKNKNKIFKQSQKLTRHYLKQKNNYSIHTYLAINAKVIDIIDMFFPPNRKPDTVLYFVLTKLKYIIIARISPKTIPNRQYSATLK